MWRFLLTIFLWISASLANASDYSFVSLYSANGFFTEKLLTFRVDSKSNSDFLIKRVSVAKPCDAMIDLHRANMIHIYCSEETDTSFIITLESDGKQTTLRSPVFSVNQVALISSNPRPKDSSIGKSKGRISFENRCIKCHQSTNIITKGVTRETLTNAFSGLPMRNGKTTDKMINFKTFFSTSELDDLVSFINEEM